MTDNDRPVSAEERLRAAAIKACEAHYEHEHVNMTIPCAAAVRDAEWWADALRVSVPAEPGAGDPLRAALDALTPGDISDLGGLAMQYAAVYKMHAVYHAARDLVGRDSE